MPVADREISGTLGAEGGIYLGEGANRVLLNSTNLRLSVNGSLVNGVQPSGDATGATDSTRIQAAINALPTSGGIVFLDGTYNINTPILRPSFVRISGSGAGTMVRAASGFVGTAMVMSAANLTEQVGIEHLTLDGNKANIASGSPHGIYIFNSGTLFPFTHTDAHNKITDVFIYNCKGDGVRFDGSTANARESKLTRVEVYACDGHGFNVILGTDLKFTTCVAGNNGLNGYLFGSGAIQVANSKAFGSGQIDPTNNGYGFRIKSGQTQLTGCNAQDNLNHGFLSEGLDSMMVGCLADSNGSASVHANGFVFSFGGGAAMACTAIDRFSGAAQCQTYGFAINALDFQSTVIDNVTISGTARGNITAGKLNSSSGTNNSIVLTGAQKFP